MVGYVRKDMICAARPVTPDGVTVFNCAALVLLHNKHNKTSLRGKPCSSSNNNNSRRFSSVVKLLHLYHVPPIAVTTFTLPQLQPHLFEGWELPAGRFPFSGSVQIDVFAEKWKQTNKQQTGQPRTRTPQ